MKLFDGSVPWYMLWSHQFRWPLHINRGELKPSLYWLRILGYLGDCDGCIALDLSDNSTTTGALRHGRSPAWGINQDLRQRCVLEGLTGLGLGPLWTSTACQPADIDTRKEKLEAGPKLRLIEMGARIVILSSIGEKLSLNEVKLDAPLVELRWDTHRGKKFDPVHKSGVDHMWGLWQTGLVCGFGYWADLDKVSAENTDCLTRSLYVALTGLVDLSLMSSDIVGFVVLTHSLARDETDFEKRVRLECQSNPDRLAVIERLSPSQHAMVRIYCTRNVVLSWPKLFESGTFGCLRSKGSIVRNVVRATSFQACVSPA